MRIWWGKAVAVGLNSLAESVRVASLNGSLPLPAEAAVVD